MNEEIIFNETNNNVVPFSGDVSNKIDAMFDSLTDEINGFNKFVYDIGKQKKENSDEYKQLQEERTRIDKAKLDFENYVRITNDSFAKREEEMHQYLNSQKQNLDKAELDFKEGMDNSLKELELEKKNIELLKQKFIEDQEQFEKYKNLEMDRIHHSEQILASDKEQFEKYKEVSNQKIELDTKNLEQKCQKFKELIGQFNSKFNTKEEE